MLNQRDKYGVRRKEFNRQQAFFDLSLLLSIKSDARKNCNNRADWENPV